MEKVGLPCPALTHGLYCVLRSLNGGGSTIFPQIFLKLLLVIATFVYNLFPGRAKIVPELFG